MAKTIHFDTPQRVREYLSEALSIVAELAPTDDLRPHVFVKAVDLLAAKQVFFSQADAQDDVMRAMAIPRGAPH